MNKDKIRNFYNSIILILATYNQASAWNKGVTEYAFDLVYILEEEALAGRLSLEDTKSAELLEEKMLNGAEDWKRYSWGGCALITDEDIAMRLATPSELRRTDYGRLKPNKYEDWLDTQARALYQASTRVTRAFHDYWKKKGEINNE